MAEALVGGICGVSVRGADTIGAGSARGAETCSRFAMFSDASTPPCGPTLRMQL